MMSAPAFFTTPSQHSRIRIFRKFPPVGPDDPMDVMPIKQLNDAAGNLNEFEIAGIVFQKQQTRYSQWIAIPHGIVPQCRRNRSRSVAGLVRVRFSISVSVPPISEHPT